ncbi:MAG TPA: hypothetical protein PK906_12500 [Spirochaetota bacterium]|nr:hypothetical protein [Spirochaetota bacterium]
MSTCIVTPDAMYGFLELAIVAAGIVFVHFSVRNIIKVRMSRTKG